MNTIHKYRIKESEEFELELPAEYKVLTIQMQFGIPHMWIMVNTVYPMQPVRFRIFGTGHDLGKIKDKEYIGTFQQDSYVWHLFRFKHDWEMRIK